MPDRSLGIDIGGTFTDFVLIDTESRTLRVWKVLTTPQDPTLAIMRGVAAQPIVDAGGLDSLARVIHGTTLVANTIIERTGAKVGLILTAGHRDVLRIEHQAGDPAGFSLSGRRGGEKHRRQKENGGPHEEPAACLARELLRGAHHDDFVTPGNSPRCAS